MLRSGEIVRQALDPTASGYHSQDRRYANYAAYAIDVSFIMQLSASYCVLFRSVIVMGHESYEYLGVDSWIFLDFWLGKPEACQKGC